MVLSCFFLQTKRDVEELILLKITSAVDSLFVESDPSKWKRFLPQENGKWVICDMHDKTMHRTENVALLSHENLAKEF